MYHQQGRFDEVEALNARALAIRDKALGAEHPDVAIAQPLVLSLVDA